MLSFVAAAVSSGWGEGGSPLAFPAGSCWRCLFSPFACWGGRLQETAAELSAAGLRLQEVLEEQIASCPFSAKPILSWSLYLCPDSHLVIAELPVS